MPRGSVRLPHQLAGRSLSEELKIVLSENNFGADGNRASDRDWPEAAEVETVGVARGSPTHTPTIPGLSLVGLPQDHPDLRGRDAGLHAISKIQQGSRGTRRAKGAESCPDQSTAAKIGREL